MNNSTFLLWVTTIHEKFMVFSQVTFFLLCSLIQSLPSLCNSHIQYGHKRNYSPHYYSFISQAKKAFSPKEKVIKYSHTNASPPNKTALYYMFYFENKGELDIIILASLTLFVVCSFRSVEFERFVCRRFLSTVQ